MISVLLNWIYMGITTFTLGFAIKKLAEKSLSYSMRNMDSVFMTGVIAATVYAQIFSLFGPVALWANIIMILVCLAVCIAFGREMTAYLRNAWKQNGKIYHIVLLCLIALWAFFTSRGYLIYDSHLYHAQSIRWLEEYGVVKGLGNLHARFAYNSSIFSFSALYSMKFLVGQSLHTGNGFIALLLSVVCMRVGKGFRNKKLCWSDFARVAGIYYLTTLTDEIISPSSDYCSMCIIFYILIKWLDELENQTKDIAPYGLLCVVGVYALTLKLTVGLILLLVLKPAYMLIREKRRKEIALYLGTGILVCAPWMIRTVIISGYLLYPFPQLDLFSFDWKINPAIAANDAAEIKVWGRSLYSAALIDVPVTEWFPGWLKGLSAMQKLFILGDLASLVILPVWILYCMIKKQWQKLDQILVMVTIAACYIFWQLSAPLVRYGYSYILLLVALTAGYFLIKLKKDGLIRLAIIMYGCYKLFMVVNFAWNERKLDYYLRQQDYDVYEVRELQLGFEKVYEAVSGDRTGYQYFPSTPNVGNIELRGDGFKDGFRVIQN